MRNISKTGPERYTLLKTDTNSTRSQFFQDVEDGLTSSPKFLLERYVYDARGSSLFEKVCQAPEYYLARSEKKILSEKASEIVNMLPENLTLVELGSGNSVKTRRVIESLLKKQAYLRYVPIDISFSMLNESALTLTREYSSLYIEGIAATYHDGLQILKEKLNSYPKLILWLGSSIGHVCREEAAAFLKTVRATIMADQDTMMVGIDLKKDSRILEAAYNDTLDANNCFVKNILTRINRELGGHFIPAFFKRQAIYNETEGCIKISLISMKAQQVKIDSLGLKVDFDKGEAIDFHTAYKYSKKNILALADNSDMELSGQWTDNQDMFSVNLFSTKTPGAREA